MRRYAVRGRGDIERAISGPASSQMAYYSGRNTGGFPWQFEDTLWNWADRARTTQMQDQEMAQEVALQNRWAKEHGVLAKINGQKYVPPPHDARMNPHVDLKLRASLNALPWKIATQRIEPRSIVKKSIEELGYRGAKASTRAKYALAGLGR